MPRPAPTKAAQTIAYSVFPNMVHEFFKHASKLSFFVRHIIGFKIAGSPTIHTERITILSENESVETVRWTSTGGKREAVLRACPGEP